MVGHRRGRALGNPAAARRVRIACRQGRVLENAREIGTAGVQLLKSINDVIDSAKLDIDGLRLDIEELDLSACLAAVMADMSNLMADRQIQLQLDAGEELPSVNGDARRTKQILHSIVHNAVKYSPQQALLLISVKPQGTFVRVSVVDRGCGISKETLDMTIRPFVDETNVLTKSHGGLGLGLWLSRRIMELQNGVITIVTSPDQGTSVHLDFPAF